MMTQEYDATESRGKTVLSLKCQVEVITSNFTLPTSNFFGFFLAQESATLSKNTLPERKGGPE